MAQNDLLALDANYSTWLKTRGSGLNGVDPFEYYCVQHFLKPYPVDDVELRAGMTNGSKDGGIDAFYFFANRKFVTDDTSLDLDAEYQVNLVIFQIKTGAGFSPTELQKQYFFNDDLLDLTRTDATYDNEYNTGLKNLMRVLKEQYGQIAGTVIRFTIDYFYITKIDCDLSKDDSDISAKRARVLERARTHFTQSECNYHFINASKLLVV